MSRRLSIQYNRWIKSDAGSGADRCDGANFKPMWIGLHWPSLPWGDEELGHLSFSDGNSGRKRQSNSRDLSRSLGLSGDARPLLETMSQRIKADAAAELLPADAAGVHQAGRACGSRALPEETI